MDLARISRQVGRLAAIGNHEMDDLETRLRYEFTIELQKLRKRIEVLEDKPWSKKFVKPTVAQVADYMREYCHEKGIQTNVDPQEFVGHYDSNGWKVGGKGGMKDWKASVRLWIRRDIKESKAEQKKDYVTDMRQRTEKTRQEGRVKDPLWEKVVPTLFGDNDT